MILYAKGKTDKDFMYCQACINHSQAEYEKYIKWSAPGFKYDRLGINDKFTDDGYCSLCILKELWNE